MLEIKKKGKESIESMLKRLKKKWRDTNQNKEIRSRGEFVKKSVKNRATKLKAKYVQKKFGNK